MAWGQSQSTSQLLAQHLNVQLAKKRFSTLFSMSNLATALQQYQGVRNQLVWDCQELFLPYPVACIIDSHHLWFHIRFLWGGSELK